MHLGVLLLSLSGILNGMLLQTNKVVRSLRPASSLRSIVPKKLNQPVRSVYTHTKMPGLYSSLPENAKAASPVFGGGMYESGALLRMYQVESNKLVRELYSELDGKIRVTASKSKVAYSLDPSILGLIIGALVSGKIDDPNDPIVFESIVQEWADEHVRLTLEQKDDTPKGKKQFEDEKKKIYKKVRNLLKLIADEYRKDNTEQSKDKNKTLSLLVGFLWGKASPDDFHAMNHYLASLDKYLPIREQQSSTTRFTSWLSKTKKDIISFFSFQKKNVGQEYTAQDYTEIQKRIDKMSHKDALNQMLGDNFEKTLSLFLYVPKSSLTYPSRVILGRYGYQGKPAKPDCSEAVLRDLCNILLFNKKTQLFDVSLLPSQLKINPAFKDFYTKYGSLETINSHITGQAFMNLVSNVPGVSYCQGNYELKAKDMRNNLITLMNYFLATEAKDLEELGAALSDERRTITFSQTKLLGSIRMQVVEVGTHEDFKLNIFSTNMHSALVFPKRSAETGDISLNVINVLLQSDQTNPQVKALLSVVPVKISWSKIPLKSMPASYYYELKFDNQVEMVKHMLNYSSDEPGVLDYAYSLYKKLDINGQISLFCYTILPYKIGKKNENFAQSYRHFNNDISLENKIALINNIILYAEGDQEMVDYAFSLFETLPENAKSNVQGKLLLKDAWKSTQKNKEIFLRYFEENMYQVLTNNFNKNEFFLSFERDVKIIYKEIAFDQVKARLIAEAFVVAAKNEMLGLNFAQTLWNVIDNDYGKKVFLSDLLSVVACYEIHTIVGLDFNNFVKLLLREKADTNAQAQLTGMTPLLSALVIKNTNLMKLLVQNGADSNTLISLSFESHVPVLFEVAHAMLTPLHVAVYGHFIDGLEFLLTNGANPNILNSHRGQKEWQETPLGLAVRLGLTRAVQKLLQYGANPGIKSRRTADPELSYPLFESINNETKKIMSLLVNNGADIYQKNDAGMNALGFAQKKRDEARIGKKSWDKIINILTKPDSFSTQVLGQDIRE